MTSINLYNCETGEIMYVTTVHYAKKISPSWLQHVDQVILHVRDTIEYIMYELAAGSSTLILF